MPRIFLHLWVANLVGIPAHLANAWRLSPRIHRSWLKIIRTLERTYLANALPDTDRFRRGHIRPTFQLPLALANLILFYAIHVIGIRWFGRMQVIMSALKCPRSSC